MHWDQEVRTQGTQIRDQVTEDDPVVWVRGRLGIEPDELQARVLRSRGKRGILNCSRQWGKSTITAAKAVHQAMTAAKSLTLVVSPTARQSGEFLRKASGFVQQMKLQARGDGGNAMSLLLPNGSRIVGLPGSEATIRGYTAELVLIDEASRVPDEVYLAARPMMATTDGALWMMSTPWAKRGFFYEAWMNGGPEWERITAPATGCPRIKRTFLEEEERTMGARWFRREYLCEFEDSGSSIFSRDLIEQAIRVDLEPLVIG